MKRLIFSLLFASLLFSCGSNKSVLRELPPVITEKEILLNDINNLYPRATIVGSGASLIDSSIIKSDISEQFSLLGIPVTTDENGIHAELPNKILFDFDRYEIKESAKETLWAIVQSVSSGEYNIRITGHTDNIGSPEYNNALSLKRANAVAEYLTENGVNPERIETAGKGHSDPIAPNNTEENKRKNRRVTITVDGRK